MEAERRCQPAHTCICLLTFAHTHTLTQTHTQGFGFGRFGRAEEVRAQAAVGGEEVGWRQPAQRAGFCDECGRLPRYLMSLRHA